MEGNGKQRTDMNVGVNEGNRMWRVRNDGAFVLPV